MKLIAAFSVLICGLLDIAVGVTVREIIDQRPELSTLKTYLKNNLDSDAFRSRTSAVTFFAPSNDAFNLLPEHLRQSFQNPSISDKAEFRQIIKRHTVVRLTQTDDYVRSSSFLDTVSRLSSEEGSPMFTQRVQQTLYINGARLVQRDIETENGIVHIIDSVYTQRPESLPIFEYLDRNRQATQEPRFSEFYALLKAYEEQTGSMDSMECNRLAITHLSAHNRVRTLFAPTNAAIMRIPTATRQVMKNSPNIICKVIESHIVLDQAYYKNVLLDNSGVQLEALNGYIMPKYYGGQVTVNNQCAQGRVKFPDLTMGNGVIHGIDGVMGFVYNDIMSELESRRDLSRFRQHVSSSPTVRDLVKTMTTGEVADGDKITLFAPTDTAMAEVDVTQASNLAESLQKHMLPGVVELVLMRDGSSKQTLAPGFPAHFMQTDKETYIEVDHLRANITQWDICVRNGILHVIDHYLGAPTASVYEQIRDTFSLKEMWDVVRQVGMDNILMQKSPMMTIFAPNNTAFQQMRLNEHGEKLLRDDRHNRQELRYVFERHIVEKVIFLGELQSSSMVERTVLGDDIKITRQGGRFVVSYMDNRYSVRVLQSDIRMTNGVMHIIDNVMYDRDHIRTSESTGGARAVIASITLLVVLLLLQITPVIIQ